MFARKLCSIVFIALLLSPLLLAIEIWPVEAAGETIYIRTDGSIDPPTAPIQRDGDVYTLTGNITSSADGIVIEKPHIVLDGAFFTLSGTGAVGNRWGVLLDWAENVGFLHNVTIRNLNVNNFRVGIWCSGCYYTFSGNNITGNSWWGIRLDGSGYYPALYNNFSDNIIAANGDYGIYLSGHANYNVISNNIMTTNGAGIRITEHCLSNVLTENNVTANTQCGIRIDYGCTGNTLSGNEVANDGEGICLYEVSSNVLCGNNVIGNAHDAILLYNASYNTLYDNTVVCNGIGVSFYGEDNVFLHNNFLDNLQNTYVLLPLVNSWDGGYPSGGNYWSDYTDVDFYRGPYQNETGGDGILDHPYTIDSSNQDRYPLVNPRTQVYGIPVDFRFERDLSLQGKGGYYNHPDVRCLQILLNSDPVTRVGTSGDGSQGKESIFFGVPTENAVKIFQKKYGLPETGYVGQVTRGKLNEILDSRFTEEYKLKFGLLNKQERKSTIWEDIKAFKSSYLPQDFPAELVLAVAVQETGDYAYWNNEFVADDWGRGIMQITTNSYVGAGGINSNSEECIRSRNRESKVYSSMYYSNTQLGIEANIKDGLYALWRKYQSINQDKIKPTQGYTKEELVWISTVQRYNVKSDKPTSYVYAIGDRLIGLANDEYGIFDGFNTTVAQLLGQKFQEAYSESARLYSPGELRVYDGAANITGVVNGEIREEIPNSLYDNETETIVVFFPSQNYYRVAGTETWTYDLHACFTNNSEVTTFSAVDIPTSMNTTHQYTIHWDVLSQGGDGVTVNADLDADGIFEYTFASDATLDRTEYVNATTKYDIGVTGIAAQKSIIGQGYSLLINTTVFNYGAYTELINVTIYLNTTLLASQTITMASASSTMITFSWNTTNWLKGDYTISANAARLPGEAYTVDNTFVYEGIVEVAMVGDVDANGKVEIKDFALMTRSFGANNPDPRYVADYDIDDNGRIEIKDFAIAAKNYGRIDP